VPCSRGIQPGATFCPEFAISVYQAAALLPAMKDLKHRPPQREDKGEIKDWVKDNPWA
jgi:hypothetical protein